MDPSSIRLGDHQRLRVISATDSALEVESTWQPGTPPQAHWHPFQTEDFTVLEGELTVELGHEGTRVLIGGDTLQIPPRTAHRMWNAGPDTARARWLITPAQRTEQMFRRIDRGLGPLSSLAFLWTYRREYRPGAPRK